MHVAKAVAWYFAASMVLWLLDIAIGQDLERYVAARTAAGAWPQFVALAYSLLVGALSLSVRLVPAYLLWQGWTLERIAIAVCAGVETMSKRRDGLDLGVVLKLALLVGFVLYVRNHNSASNPAAPPPLPEPAPTAQAQPIDPVQLEKARREPTPEEMERARRLFDGK